MCTKSCLWFVVCYIFVVNVWCQIGPAPIRKVSLRIFTIVKTFKCGDMQDPQDHDDLQDHQDLQGLDQDLEEV